MTGILIHTNQSINQSINQSVSQSINQQSINQSRACKRSRNKETKALVYLYRGTCLIVLCSIRVRPVFPRFLLSCLFDAVIDILF